MKKSILIVVLACFSLFLCGCVKYEYNFEVDKKQNVNISMYSGFNIGAINSVFSAFAPEGRNNDFETSIEQELENGKTRFEQTLKGYDVEVVKNDGFVGYMAKNSFLNNSKSQEEIVLPIGIENLNDKLIVAKETTFKNTYTGNFVFNANKLNSNVNGASYGSSMSGVQGMDASNFKGFGFDPVCKITIKLPSKAIQTNADEKDDKNYIYTWNLELTSGYTKKIDFVYGGANIANIIILILILIGVGFFAISLLFTQKDPDKV